MAGSFEVRTMARLLVCSLVCAFVSGCISEQISQKYDGNKSLAAATVSRLNSATVCCTSYREIRYQTLENGKRLELSLTPSSPVFDFPFGRSRFVGFQMPMAPNAIELHVTAIELQSGVKPTFRPRALLLDRNFELIHNQPKLSFDKYYFGATTEGHTARIGILTSLVRYVIIAADPDFIGKEHTGGGKSYAMPTGGGYVGVSIPQQRYPYGYEGKAFIAVKSVAN